MKTVAISLATILAIGAIFYVSACLYLYFKQKDLVYFPSRDVFSQPDTVGLAYEEVTLTTTDGVRINGWYLPAPHPRGTLLFFHGNAGNMANRIPALQFYHTFGVNIFIIDYRGYGKSAGAPTERGTYLDARAAWDYLLYERGEVPERIVILGRSLGAAIAAQLAGNVTPAGVILEGAFTSVPDMGARLYPWLPVRALARFKYATREYATKITSPTLVIHSADDEIAPVSMGREVYDALAVKKRFVETQGGHDDAYIVSEELYVSSLTRFLVEALPSSESP